MDLCHDGIVLHNLVDIDVESMSGDLSESTEPGPRFLLLLSTFFFDVNCLATLDELNRQGDFRREFTAFKWS